MNCFLVFLKQRRQAVKDERKNEIVAFDDFAPAENVFVGSIKKIYDETSAKKKCQHQKKVRGQREKNAQKKIIKKE